MINRGFPIELAPQVVEISPLLPTSTVFLKVHQEILRILRGQVVQQLVKRPPTHEGIAVPERLLRNSRDLLLGQ